MNEKTAISSLKVLVVDDSDFSRNLISQMVTEAGHQVIGEAASAEAALKLLQEKNPHVVITDIVMPKISGIELTEKISQNHDQISIIVVSSLSQEHIVLEAIAAGANDFISKPIQRQQLSDSLEKILEQIRKG
jgi:two-component system, chemotaxis family, chemotaxis protein CheY